MSAYEDLWGMDAHHDGHGDHNHEVSESVDSILGRLRESVSNRACACESWITELAQDCKTANNDLLSSSVVVSRPVVSWMGILFDYIGKYVEQFNYQLDHSGLTIDIEPPAFHHVACREGASDWINEKERVIYEGHIAMAYDSYIVRGKEQKIDFFLVPSNLLLGFSLNNYGEDDFPSLTTIDFSEQSTSGVILETREQGTIVRQIVGEEILPELARYLLSTMIRSNVSLSSRQSALSCYD